MNTISDTLKSLNKKLYNAGFSFRAVKINASTLLVEGSFDFSYYTQVHIQFHEVLFTNLKDGDTWDDAWNNDQLFLLDGEFRIHALELNNLKSIPTEFEVFQFNVDNWNKHKSGLVIAKSIQVNFFTS